MFTEVIINAFIIVGAIIVLEFIRALIHKRVSKEYVEKSDFDEFKKDCINCQKALPREYVTCDKFIRDMDRLEKIHRDDVTGIYATMKGGFESIGSRVDKLVDGHERN